MKNQISNRKSKIILLIAACVTLAAFGPLTAGPLTDGNKALLGAKHSVLQYEFETIDAPGRDPTVTIPFLYTWINNSGMLVQNYADAVPNAHTAVRIRDTWQELEVPGALAIFSTNPNEAGRVALGWFDSNYAIHLAIWQEHRPLQYVADAPPDPQYHYSGPNGFNDLGIVTAWTFVAGNPDRGLGLLQDTHTGGYQLLIYPGTDILWTLPLMTNNRGITVGNYTTLTYESHAITWDGHQFTNIDVPGGTNQSANFINNEGYIVGNYTDGSGATVGFVRDPKGQVTDFMVPDALQTVPDCITENLQISGAYQAQDGEWHGFVATPAR